MKNGDIEIQKAENSKFKLWIKRVGFLGFLFFLAKGLVWIGVAVFAGKKLFD